MRSDQNYVDALQFGMPPTAGWGGGIDRMCMLFTGVSQIREVILFPMFRTSVLTNKGKKKDKKKVKPEAEAES